MYFKVTEYINEFKTVFSSVLAVHSLFYRVLCSDWLQTPVQIPAALQIFINLQSGSDLWFLFFNPGLIFFY